jgi:hypothetical protein
VLEPLGPPLFVIVCDKGWTAYTVHYPPTPWDEKLYAMLLGMGGIHDQVNHGIYFFNAAYLDETNIVLSLEAIRIKI